MNDFSYSALACESEPINAPDAIQSWGALVIADANDLVVRYASANLDHFLTLSGPQAIGRPLTDVIGAAGLAGLLARPRSANVLDGTVNVLAPRQPGEPMLSVVLHRLDDRLYLEIEPVAQAPNGLPASGGWTRGRAMIAALRAARTIPELFAIATTQLRDITGFDRVLVYRFDDDCHGEVIAENSTPDQESLLGLHFPAVDIPPQARRIFAQVILRIIADSHAAPVRLLGGPGALSPDLSLSLLRSPSPCHLEYLRNFGSHATATIAITMDGALWGLLACHHRSPAHLPPAVRALCELIGQITSLMVATLHDSQIRLETRERRTRLAAMSARLAVCCDDPASLASALAGESTDLLAICDAAGAVVRLGGRTVGCGEAPRGDAAAELLDALLAQAPHGGAPFACDRLSDLLPANLLAGTPPIAGALLLPMIHTPGDAIAWLRPEKALHVKWGGDPNHPMQVDALTGRLTPRNSFAVWRQEVHGQSLPWLPAQPDAAQELRRELNQLLAGYTESMRVARETAERATRAKAEFLATMSHEIRSPMSGLLGVLELLRATSLDTDQSRMAGMIHNSASMLLAVLNDILDFSKIEAGALSIALEPAGLRNLVLCLVQPLSAAAKPKGLTVLSFVDPDVPDRISTDPLRLRQILGNLLSNALKFTAAGEVSLSVDVVGEPDSPSLRFRVRDSGIGMSPDVMSRLFAPFMQADGSTTRNFGGTGLGLCISRQLAVLFGGDLTVTSEVGVGSEFSLSLPLLPCTGETDDSVIVIEPAETLTSTGKRVLVVEDDATIRWLSQRQLQKLGVDAEIVDDGESGLRQLHLANYHLVLTDCHMPLMDGVALTRRVRADPDPVLSRIPIIGLTADVTERQRALCHDAGMNELVIKPLTVERLAQLLRRHLAADDGLPAPADAMPTLRHVAFDDQIYLSIFTQTDAEGATWLNEWLATARMEKSELSDLLAAATPEAEAIRGVAHRLAGASFSVGAMLLGEAARALEVASAQEGLPMLRQLNAALAHALTEVEGEIRMFLDGAGPVDQVAAIQFP